MTYYPITVNQMFMDSVFWTLGLLTVTTLIAFTAGTVLGGLFAWPDVPGLYKIALLPVMAVSAVPQYLLGLLIAFALAFQLSWLPLFGGYSIGASPGTNIGFYLDVLQHSVLPALALIAGATGFWALSMRGMMVTALEADFMTLAQAKGLKGARLFYRYAMRNSLLPQTTGLAVSLGTVLSGVVLVEIVFAYPGLGDTLFRAVRRYDYFVVSGLVFTMATMLAIATFILDVLYPRLDPRVRRET
jgi:peptide/nickel transport system permease protein